jgi:hypothetical protein
LSIKGVIMRLAEYIWLDGTEPTPMMRSKTKVLDPEEQPPTWGFDGSSTKQAEGESSDCVLKPTTIVRDPFRGGEFLSSVKYGQQTTSLIEQTQGMHVVSPLTNISMTMCGLAWNKSTH